MPGSNYLAFLSLTFALVITPGSTTAVVVRNTLAGGVRAGLWSALGAAVGNSSHAAAAGLGLAVLLTRSPLLFLIVQVTGGLYLAWLGFQSLRRIRRHNAVPASQIILGPTEPPRPHHAWREGVSVNLLNPSIATFYLAVVPSFVPADAYAGTFAWLAATHVLMALCVHSLWVVALHRLKAVLARPAARLGLEVVTAGALLLLAARVLWTASVTSI